jgi:ferredoxin
MIKSLTNIIIPKYKLNYNIERDKNIIQASLAKNIKLPFSCRSGVCGTCKAKIIKGKVNLNTKINHVLTESDKENNIILTCQAEAASDLLELEMLSPVANQIIVGKPKELISEILSVKQITQEIKLISISVSKRFAVNPSQLSYMEIIIPGIDVNDKYYIFNNYNGDNLLHEGTITLYVKNNKNLITNKYLNKNLLTGEIITIKGPFLEKNIPIFMNSPTLFLSKDSHTIKTLNIIRELLLTGFKEPIMIISYFIDIKNIILMEEMHRLQFLYKNFTYKISLLNKASSTSSRFLLGSISKNINKIFPNLSSHYIYINGDDDFILETKKKINELSAKDESIYIELNN